MALPDQRRRLGYDKACTVWVNKEDVNAWTALSTLKIPGHEISGISYSFAGSGGYVQLLVYWRKIAETTTATPEAPKPADVVLNVDKLTVQTGKVVVHRR